MIVHSYSEMVRFGVPQPYLRERQSLKAVLCKAKPCSSMGSVVNQVEAPFPERVPWNVGEGPKDCFGVCWHLLFDFCVWSAGFSF